MKPQEYKQKLEDIALEYNKQKIALAREYALSNNKIIKGDVVRDRSGYIKVENISVHLPFIGEYHECVYYGTELRKDLTPKKNGHKRNVHQCNLI